MPSYSRTHNEDPTFGNTPDELLAALTAAVDSILHLKGKSIYFTGIFRMSYADREKLAKKVGFTQADKYASPGHADMLVLGSRYGAKKIPKAERWGHDVLHEGAFFGSVEIQNAMNELGLAHIYE